MSRTPAAFSSCFSMTGYGAAEAELAGQKFRLEIRSVNHRFLDLKLRLPREFQPHDTQIRSLVQGSLARGSIDLKLERAQGDGPSSLKKLRVDLDRAREIHTALEKIRSELNLSEPVILKDITQFGDVIQVEDAGPIPSQDPGAAAAFWENELGPLVRRALQELCSMREREGQALARLLSTGMDDLEAMIASIRSERARSEGEMKARLTEKLRRVLEAYPVPAPDLLETRLAQELALVLDRTDIQEELDRFQGHIAHFRNTLAQGQQLGRKLEFLLQELGREINTLGNKAQDLGISKQVVAAKVRLEQLREQVLNLE